uniref:Lipoprotein n=1 Tax=Strongyloides papillosus TaxID=174720 RepID=A0A0N5B9H0_STREA
MNDSIIDLISNTKIPPTPDVLDKGYWDTMEGQALKSAKRWARDVLISLTSVILLIIIIISVSCIRAFIKSRNDALLHDPEERWIKSMSLDGRLSLMDSNLYKEQAKLLLVNIDEKEDIQNLFEKIEGNCRNGIKIESVTEEEG